MSRKKNSVIDITLFVKTDRNLQKYIVHKIPACRACIKFSYKSAPATWNKQKPFRLFFRPAAESVPGL